MEICWEKYHTDVHTAKKHHEIGHKHESETLMLLLGCMQAAKTWEMKKEICPKQESIVNCIAAYNAEEFVLDLQRRNKKDLAEEEKTPQEAAVEGGEETATNEQPAATTS